MLTPPSYSWSIVSNSTSTWEIDGTLDGIYSAGQGVPTNTSTAAVTFYSLSSGSSVSVLYMLSSGPINAWRVNMTAKSSAGASITVTFVQAGVA